MSKRELQGILRSLRRELARFWVISCNKMKRLTWRLSLWIEVRLGSLIDH